MATHDIPKTMQAVLLTGHGGFDKLVVRDDVPVPQPAADAVLIRVGAAAINNTDINTRTAWYSKAVAEGTTRAGGTGGFAAASQDDASWAGKALTFPRIQGIDVCGTIVGAGADVSPSRIGERILVEPCLRSPVDWAPYQGWFLGSECDGGFAEYVAVPAVHAYRIECSLSDVELASFPCAYSTAENMLTRAKLQAGERILITGASGGVGSAAIQLAKRRGAEVLAVTSPAKTDTIKALGATTIFSRDTDLTQALGPETIDVVVDLVAGPMWPQFLKVLKRGGRYAVAGAIGHPNVELDVRSLYLKDLSFFGCAILDQDVFPNLINYIAGQDIHPIVAETFPLSEIVAAQQSFLDKGFVGKIVLVPDALWRQ
ncbi:MAG: alcohol dehydrogenase family protein [Pseudomonadota bacterium]